MRVFRQFDYFRKSTSPEQIKSTCLGGFSSICCLLALAFLIYNEILIFSEPEITKNTTVSTDPDKHSHIIVNMNVTFPNMPCFLIELTMKTSVNSMDQEDINRKLTWQHIDDDGFVVQKWQGEKPFESIDLSDTEKTPDMIKSFFTRQLTCNVAGSINPSKVTGNMRFDLLGNSKAFTNFTDRYNSDDKYKVQLNHKINELTFGNQKGHEKIREVFGDIDNGTHTIFNMFHDDHKVNDSLKFNVEDEAQDYFYFCKLVPHVFVDLIEMNQRSSYSYSLNHNKKAADYDKLLTLTIILDYAPVKLIVTKQNRELGKLMIDLCSIVGGVFVIFGLLNGLLLRCCEKCKSD